MSDENVSRRHYRVNFVALRRVEDREVIAEKRTGVDRVSQRQPRRGRVPLNERATSQLNLARASRSQKLVSTERSKPACGLEVCAVSCGLHWR